MRLSLGGDATPVAPTLGTACCGIEMMSVMGPGDLARYGAVARFPRQADLLLIWNDYDKNGPHGLCLSADAGTEICNC